MSRGKEEEKEKIAMWGRITYCDDRSKENERVLPVHFCCIFQMVVYDNMITKSKPCLI